MPFDFSTARTNMVNGQIRPNKVNDTRLLSALEQLPRESFAPADLAVLAYSDIELPVSKNRCLLAPMVLARMIDAMQITANDRVLDISPVTGYSTAILAQLAMMVVALEPDADMASNTAKMLQASNCSNAQAVHGPISLGAKQFAPYDSMLINGAMADVPRTLFHQLAEGGKLVAIINDKSTETLGRVTLFTKHHNTISERVLFEAAASYIPGFAPVEAFAL